MAGYWTLVMFEAIWTGDSECLFFLHTFERFFVLETSSFSFWAKLIRIQQIDVSGFQRFSNYRGLTHSCARRSCVQSFPPQFSLVSFALVPLQRRIFLEL